MATRTRGRHDHPGDGPGGGRAVRGRASGDSERPSRRQPGQPPGSGGRAASGREHCPLRRHGHDGRAGAGRGGRRYRRRHRGARGARNARPHHQRRRRPHRRARRRQRQVQQADPCAGTGLRRAIDRGGDPGHRHQGGGSAGALRQGRQGRALRRRRRRQDRHHHGADQQHRQGSTAAIRCSPAWASGRARATTSTTR